VTDPETRRNPVEELAEEFLARYRRGERPPLTEYADRHPELADDIRDLFPALLLLEHVGPPAPDALARCDEPAPRRLGDYRVLREVGRGGMGVVYEAQQEALGRRVALKVLPPALAADPTCLGRFRREARAAARLHHSNIVPVFDVGECHGVHYYAMQFIEGHGLDAVLRQLRRLAAEPARPPTARPPNGHKPGSPATPSVVGLAEALRSGRFPAREAGSLTPDAGIAGADHSEGSAPTVAVSPTALVGQPDLAAPSGQDYFRAVARLGRQAAEALAHAHGQRVLHRDIKPANLLLDVHGTLWVSDFGLAKGEEGDDLTATGDVVGTLRYMAPERFNGTADARGDVYSLGATLYELLALRPAFAETVRSRLVRQVLHEEPTRPSRLDPAVPRDLETICLKAMAKDPARRYQTADDLADDLARFLADRPIRARRASAAEQGWRWCRRNPVVAGLAALVVTLVAAVAVIAVLDDRRLRREEEGTRRQLYDALVAQARASQLSRRAGQRFDGLRAVEAATRLARQLKRPPEDFLGLRNEAIACLALPDLRVTREWEGWPEGSAHVDFDGALERYARTDHQGGVSVRRVADDERICDFKSGLRNAVPRLSPDGRFLALADPPRFELWRLDGPRRMELPPALACAAHDFSPDGRWLAAVHPDGAVSLYDLTGAEPVRRWPHGPRPVHSAAFHPHNRRLAISFGGGVQVRDLSTGGVECDLALSGAEHLAWHPDGRTLAVVGGDRTIHLWDVAARRELSPLWKWKNGQLRISFNRSGDLLASFGREQMLRLWEPRLGAELFHTPATCAGTALRFRDDGVLAAGIRDDKLCLWEFTPGRECRRLVRNPPPADALCGPFSVSPDGRFLAARTPDGFGLWDLRTAALLASVREAPPDDILFEPSGALLTAGPAGVLRRPMQADAAGVMHLGPPQRLPVPEAGGAQLACSRDRGTVAIARRGGAVVLHADRPDQPLRLEPQEDVRTVAVSPDGRWVAAGSRDGTGARVWDTRTGELVKELLPHEGGVRVGFSRDGRWLATRGNGLRLWAVDSWEEGPRLGGLACGAFAFSPAEKLLAMETGQGAVSLVDPDTGREYARLTDPDQVRVAGMCFSPDGQTLLTTGGGRDAWIRAWDLRSIRRQLAGMGLDWGLTPYPPAEPSQDVPARVVVEPGQSLPPKP
jgi:serine/threonine protein kinase/WD40 repeat protein